MEVEARPFLIGDDEKLGSLMYARRSKKESRLRSWALAIMTHGFVALLVLLAMIVSPMAGFMSRHELWNGKARPTLYCMFKGWPLSFDSLTDQVLSTFGTCYQVYHRPSASGLLVQPFILRAS